MQHGGIITGQSALLGTLPNACTQITSLLYDCVGTRGSGGCFMDGAPMSVS